MAENQQSPVQSNPQDKTVMYALISIAVIVTLPVICFVCYFVSSALFGIAFLSSPSLYEDYDKYENYKYDDYYDVLVEPTDVEDVDEADYAWTYVYAAELDLDMEQFKNDLEDPIVIARVADDILAAEQNDVIGTPAYYIAGTYRGTVPILDEQITWELEHGSDVVIIDEYIDMQCPYCKQTHEADKLLKEKWGNKIDIRLKHYPLSNIHENAYAAAVASEAAREQGKFDEFVDLIFENQDDMKNPVFAE